MVSNTLVEKLEKLPADLQKEVVDFVDFLIFKNQDEVANTENRVHQPSTGEDDIVSYTINDPNGFYSKKPKLKREFGGLKGQIWMSDDFDEPLEDFKDYM